MLYYLCSRCQFKIQANKHICPTCGHKVVAQKADAAAESKAPRANVWLKMIGLGDATKNDATREKPALAD